MLLLHKLGPTLLSQGTLSKYKICNKIGENAMKLVDTSDYHFFRVINICEIYDSIDCWYSDLFY